MKRDVNATLLVDGEAAVRARHDRAAKYQADGKKANGKAQEQAPGEGVTIDDFRAHLPSHTYIYMPSREPWPASSVNAKLPPMPVLDRDGTLVLDAKGKPKFTPAAAWLDQHRSVEQMAWAPGMPTLIRDRLVREGGWVLRKKVVTLNLYQPPAILPGDAAKAGPWRDHVRRVFGDVSAHLEKWLAHRVQKPQEKINHAIVLGGAQGIGKDTLLEPVKRAVGPWNFAEVSPQQMLGRFNGFAKSVILRVSEARDLGDVDRFQFYDHAKAYTAAPPDVLRCDEKNLREHAVLNCCGVIITSNHKQDGIFLPQDDRRHFVAWSDLTKDDFPKNYWNDLYRFYDDGGDRHVAAYLAQLDLSHFDPKAPPPKTPAFWAIVDAGRSPEDAELADVLDRMGNPDVTTLARIANEATDEFGIWIKDRKNRRAIPHRLDKAGYSPVRNDAAIDGMWKINGARQVVYAKITMTPRDRLAGTNNLIRQSSK